MDAKLLANATFSEVYNFLKEKPDSKMFQCLNSLFGVSLLVFPGLMCQDVATITNLATGATLAGAGIGTLIGNAAKDMFKLLQRKNYNDYTTCYEHMQIAQVMLVYAAYFDTISQCLPDENGEIMPSKEVRLRISEKGLHSYMERLQEKAGKRELPQNLKRKMIFPEPTQAFSQYKIWLQDFYYELNAEFIKFFEQTQFFGDLKKGADETERKLNQYQKYYFLNILNELPKAAVETYEQQYFKLLETYPDFSVWANHSEHRYLEAQIDIGFKKISEELRMLSNALPQSGQKVANILSVYQTVYTEYIEETVVKHNVSEPGRDMIFPKKNDIFIPQSFQAISFEPEMHVESEETWKDAYSGEDIGKYISSILHHPQCGELPILILGHPGAGKTLLCHMLAAQIFQTEYYVIIIRLRDTVAENTIMKQIDEQIERDLGENLKWSELREAPLDKMILLIFDGYDELLQASGKTYSNYLNRIAEFQASQRRLYGKFVRCIVTSRATLIDKASIPAGSQILRLCEFDDVRIQAWIDIWNQTNESYFHTHGLNKLEIAAFSRGWELARQPLLLLMLALYEMNGGCLKERENISRSELYYKLIWDFIAREEQKDSRFRQWPEGKQKEAIRKEFRCLGVAALGMYNRRKFFICGEELNKDLAYLMPGEMSEDSQNEYALENGDKLVGRFFFIHSSESMASIRDKGARVAAYEFLHNTFGEFLTAYYIVETVFRLVKRERVEAEQGEQFVWPFELKKNWHVSLAYAPLFARPVILDMIYELSDIFAEENSWEASEIEKALDNVFKEEIRQIRIGTMFANLDGTLCMQGNPYSHPELMFHVAVYSVNLIMLRAVIGTIGYDFATTLGEPADWQKLTYIWRYAFSEEELANLSELFGLRHTDESYWITYNYVGKRGTRSGELSKLAKLRRISDVLGDDVAFAILNAFDSKRDSRIQSILKNEKLALETKYALNEVILSLTSMGYCRHESLRHCMENLKQCSELEKDTLGLYVCYSLLNVLLENKIMDRVEISRLFNREIFFKMDEVLKGRLHSNIRILSNVVSQKILKCARYLSNTQRLKLLDEFSVYFMHRRSFFIGYSKVSNLFAMNTLLIFCRLLEDSLEKTNEEVSHNIIELLCIMVQESCQSSDFGKLFSAVLCVCQAARKAGDDYMCEKLLTYYFRKIGEDDFQSDVFEEMKADKDALEAAISGCYYMMYKHTIKDIDNWEIFLSQMLCKIDVFEQIAFLSEKAFYQLLCLLCNGKTMTSEAIINYQTGLLKIVSQHGRSLSLRTLEKIQECANLYKDWQLVEAVEEALNGCVGVR